MSRDRIPTLVFDPTSREHGKCLKQQQQASGNEDGTLNPLRNGVGDAEGTCRSGRHKISIVFRIHGNILKCATRGVIDRYRSRPAARWTTLVLTAAGSKSIFWMYGIQALGFKSAICTGGDPDSGVPSEKSRGADELASLPPSKGTAMGKVSFRGLVCDSVFRPWYALRGRRHYEHLRFLDRSQWWGAEQIREFQWGELKNLLKVAFESVPYYAQKYAGIRYDDIRSWEDFERLPILTR